MHCFYIDKHQILKDQIMITGPDVNHIKNVLRMDTQDEVTICDGDGMIYRCRLSELNGKEILADIIESKEADTELPCKIYLFQGLPKKDKMEWIIQKAVELGVFEVIPVKTKYSVVRLEEEKKEKKKLLRWQAISEAAAKQSGRGIIPLVERPVTFKEAVERIKKLDAGVIPYERSKGMDSSRAAVENGAKKGTIGILIGPEGGFSAEEVSMARDAGIEPISLGKRILRTETAGLAMLSLFMFQMECIKEAREDESGGIS